MNTLNVAAVFMESVSLREGRSLRSDKPLLLHRSSYKLTDTKVARMFQVNAVVFTKTTLDYTANIYASERQLTINAHRGPVLSWGSYPRNVTVRQVWTVTGLLAKRPFI